MSTTTGRRRSESEDAMAMLAEKTIRAEYKRVQALLDKIDTDDDPNFYELRGSRQALAWVLRDYAAMPSKCVVRVEKKK